MKKVSKKISDWRKLKIEEQEHREKLWKKIGEEHKGKPVSQKEMERVRMEAMPVTHPDHFYLAYQRDIGRIIGTLTNKQRSNWNYQTILRICKEKKIDFASIKKANLVPTFKPYFSKHKKNEGQLPLLSESQLYTYQRKFKREQSK